MSGLYGYVNGKFTDILTIHEVCEQLEYLHNEQEAKIKRLEKENAELKSGVWKDAEMAALKKSAVQMKEEWMRGFPISTDEFDAIEAWRDKHDAEKHGAVTFEQKLRREGVSGGTYSYRYTPTAIGNFGTCYCNECRQKAIEEFYAILYDSEKTVGTSRKDRSILWTKLKQKYDYEFEFQEP